MDAWMVRDPRAPRWSVRQEWAFIVLMFLVVAVAVILLGVGRFAAPSGVVVDRTIAADSYWLTMRADDGDRFDVEVDRDVWSVCIVGSEWPECKP